MSARILVVDDIDINLRLMEARLGAEFFEVEKADSGTEALRLAAGRGIDLVLLDVMMPQMDGYEVCRRLKSDPATAHIPVVLVTALDSAADRLRGLEAGADDFLTKPVRDLQLFARVRSLTRLKRVGDELRERASAALTLFGHALDVEAPPERLRAVLFHQDGREARRVARLAGPTARIEAAASREALLGRLESGTGTDAVLLDLGAGDETEAALRVLASVKASEAGRHVPVLAMGEADQESALAKALEIGATDCILKPLDSNELVARLATQARRRRGEERLRRSLTETLALATRDALTGLHNRRFLEARLAAALAAGSEADRPLALIAVDIDHFKRINDGFGHDGGDAVLVEFAERLRAGLRGGDFACRTGGEEFVVLLPGTDGEEACAIAERLRGAVAGAPFAVPGGDVVLVTTSLGVAMLRPGDDAAALLTRADRSLYEAKRQGRNRVRHQAA